MDEDPKMSEMTPRGRKAKVAFEPEDWVGFAVAVLALGALVVAVIATKGAVRQRDMSGSQIDGNFVLRNQDGTIVSVRQAPHDR